MTDNKICGWRGGRIISINCPSCEIRIRRIVRYNRFLKTHWYFNSSPSRSRWQLFLYRVSFVYLKEWQRERDQARPREIYFLMYTSNVCNDQGWARSKPRAGNSTYGSHVGGSGPNMRPTLNCFLWRINMELDQNWINWGLNWCLYALQAAAS